MPANCIYFQNFVFSLFLTYLLVRQREYIAAFAVKPDIQCGNMTCYGPQTANCDLRVFQCICQTGFDGLTCQEDQNECSGNHLPCGHRGECINTIGSFKCQCLNGWQGSHCQLTNGDIQECMPGWDLPRCVRDVDECANTSLYTCEINQHCHNTLGNYTCVCNNGWEGLSCEDDIDECIASPCNNNGTCMNINGSYTCQCPGGWHGINCADEVIDCTNITCQINDNLNINRMVCCNQTTTVSSPSTKSTNNMFTAGRVSNTNTQSLVTVAPSIAFDPKTGVIPVNKAGEGNIISGNEVANASTDDKTTSFFKEGVSVMLIMVGSAFAILTFIAGFGIAVRIFKPSSKRVRVRDMPHTRRMDDYD